LKKNRKILITGSEGFMGKALKARILSTHPESEIFQYSHSLGFDVVDPNSFQSFVGKGITDVFHLASKTFVPESWENPRAYYQTNLMGTENVLEFCRHEKAKMFYFSSYVYGTPKYLPIDENHPIDSVNPYGHSKWMAEELCRFYSKNFSVPSIILRPFNIYGPGQSDHFLISKIIHQCLSSNEISINNTKPKRDFLYIDDLTDACVTLLNSDVSSGNYNLGYGKSHSVLEVVEEILKISGKNILVNASGIERPNEVMDVVASCKLTLEGFWKPKFDLKSGIEETFLQSKKLFRSNLIQ
jgi:nucleoside-diphosphate-sugar epimerase